MHAQCYSIVRQSDLHSKCYSRSMNVDLIRTLNITIILREELIVTLYCFASHLATDCLNTAGQAEDDSFELQADYEKESCNSQF